MNVRFKKSAHAVLANGNRLVQEVKYLSYDESPSTAQFILLLAQEELAKAFLLVLVYRGVIPWGRHLHRATHDHRCKQLLFLVMDHLNPEFEEYSRRRTEWMVHKKRFEDVFKVPTKIRDAISILRHEKIGRWESNKWFWADEPKWDPEVLAISDGTLDQAKQDLVYLRLGRDGSIVLVPGKRTRFNLDSERDRAERMSELVESMIKNKKRSPLEWRNVEPVFRLLFTEPKAAPATGGDW